MPQPYAIKFGPWMPDGDESALTAPFQYSATPLPLADCLNVYWADQAYRSLPGISTSGTAVPSQVLGAAVGLGSNFTNSYAGDSSDLFLWSGTAWNNASKSAGAYAGTTRWSFAQFAGCMIAANGINVLQDLTIGGTTFADIAGSPIGTTLGVIGQFLLVGNIQSPSVVPYRLQWCGIGDPTSWPTPLTDAAIAVQSSYEDLTQDFGQVQFIMGGPLMGVAFQQFGLTRVTYVGGDVVFQFAPYDWKKGLAAPGAAAQVGPVTYFLGSDGFYATDGSQVIPIGSANTGGIDRWFWNNVNRNALTAISAAWDSTLKCVLFAVPTGSNTLPDTILLYSPSSQQWTRAQVNVELIHSNYSGATMNVLRPVASLFNQSHTWGSLSGANLTGYCETYDGGFLDGMVRDVIEVQPNIIATGSPTAQIGYRDSLQDSITYSAANTQDAFSRRVTFDPPPSGRFLRVRLTSAAASALNGATIYVEQGGV